MADESIYPSYLDEQGKFKTQFSPEEQTALLNDVNESRKQAADGGTTFAHSSVDAKSLIPAVTHGVENGYLTNYIKNKYSRLKEPQTSYTTTEQSNYNPVEPFDREKFTQEWQAGSKPVMQMLMENYKKPEPTLTPEQEQKAKFGAALTDTMGTLAQLFAHGQGARVRDTSAQPSNTQITNARLQALNDKYAQDIYRYNQAYGNAGMQDFNQLLQQHLNDKNYQRQYNLYKDKAAIASAAAKAKALQEDAKQKEQKRQFNLKQKEAARHNRASEAIAAAKKDDGKQEPYIPVMINGKQRMFPSNMIDQVVARGIAEGKAGDVQRTNRDLTGTYTTTEKVTPTTKLDKNQKRQIFESVYHNYLDEDANGNVIVKQNTTPTPAKSAPAWKMPKVPGTGSNKKKTIPGF